jgi:hypothetical protein
VPRAPEVMKACRLWAADGWGQSCAVQLGIDKKNKQPCKSNKWRSRCTTARPGWAFSNAAAAAAFPALLTTLSSRCACDQDPDCADSRNHSTRKFAWHLCRFQECIP